MKTETYKTNLEWASDRVQVKQFKKDLAQLEKKSAAQAPIFDDRLLKKIDSLRDIIAELNSIRKKPEKANADGLTFDAWYKLADATVSDVCGLGLDDLPDGPSRDSWMDGVPAAEYALGILRYEGYPL